MTQQDIQWLSEPHSELPLQKPGTLIIVGAKDGRNYLARLMESTDADSRVRFQCLPSFSVRTLEATAARGSKFALV